MPAVVTKEVTVDYGSKYVKADMAKAVIGGFKKRAWANLKIHGLDGTLVRIKSRTCSHAFYLSFLSIFNHISPCVYTNTMIHMT